MGWWINIAYNNYKCSKQGENEDELDFMLWKEALNKQLSIFWNLMSKMMDVGSNEEKDFLEYLVKKYANKVLFSDKTFGKGYKTK